MVEVDEQQLICHTMYTRDFFFLKFSTTPRDKT